MAHSVGAIPIPHPDYGAPIANCPATAATTVKSASGVLKALWISGTGTAGTVTIADNVTTLFVAQVPASAVTYALPLPPEGAKFGTSLIITTTGAGVTACAVYV